MSDENGGFSIVTFVNRFTLTRGQDEFEKAFSDIADFMRRQPGILGYTLSRNVEKPDQYVNIALWKDEASIRAAVRHPDFRSHVQALRDIATSDSELYTERARFLNEDIHTI